MIYTVGIHFEENYENFMHASITHKEDDVRDTQGFLSRQKWLKHFLKVQNFQIMFRNSSDI